MFIFEKQIEDIGPFRGATDTPFWTSTSDVCPWIQSDNMAPPPPQTHTVHHALLSWVLISIVTVNYYKDRKINIRYIWKTWIQTKVQKQLINY